MKNLDVIVTIIACILVVIISYLAYIIENVLIGIGTQLISLIILFLIFNKTIDYIRSYSNYELFKRIVKKEEIILFPTLDLFEQYLPCRIIKTGVYRNIEYLTYVKYNLKTGKPKYKTIKKCL